jgi:hypothetical protein
MTVQQAFDADRVWGERFWLQVDRHEVLPAELYATVHDESECAIGRWLRSSSTMGIRHRDDYLELCRLHRCFHKELARVAGLIQSGEFDRVGRILAPGNSFERMAAMLEHALSVIHWEHQM